MSRRSILLGLILSLICAGGLSADSKTKSSTSPSIKDVHAAFQTPSERIRGVLHAKLTHAGTDADTPEIVAAVIEGLQPHLNSKAITHSDLNFISWLGTSQQQQAVQQLHDWLAFDDLRVVLAASWAMTDNQKAVPWELIVPLTERDTYQKFYALRRTVVAAAERNASKEAIAYLIKTVRESDGQLKYEAVLSLMAVTGQGFGGYAEQWETWWSTASTTFTSPAIQPVAKRSPLKKTNASLQAKVAWKNPVPRFYNLPVYARRVLFIIDCSGSMKHVNQGESRINRARREIENAIVSLPEEAHFSIIAFNDLPFAFSQSLVLANEENKVAAVRFAQNLVAHKHTNCYDTLSMALEADPNLEAIFFLSDGEPSCGRIVVPQAIVRAITMQNHLHHTTIYTLGIDARGNHEFFLKDLAVQNHGEFFSIR